MTANKESAVLVLGATGMLGRVVYSFLKSKNLSVIGTSRKKNDKFENFRFSKKNLEILFKKNNYEFVINCIGKLKKSEMSDYSINYLLPKVLEKLSSKYTFKIINISSNAVFDDFEGSVFEDSKTNPKEKYGKSKLKGETIKNSLNIRTSFIGLDPENHNGLLEFLLNNKDKEILGYSSEKWSGATTLQLAEFIYWLIIHKNFQNLSKKTNIVHFAPLISTKYEILHSFSKLTSIGTVLKVNKNDKTTILKTRYVDEIKLDRYTIGLKNALIALLKFDENHSKGLK